MFAQVLLFFDISTGEIFIIMLVLFLVFGPQKMPEIARKIGKTINRMKQATSDLTREFNEGANEVTDTLDKEAKEIRNEVYDTKKEFDKENKKFENELSIKTDINKRGAKKRASNEERENTEVRDKEKQQDNDPSQNQ
ncbi:MAG: twin-arginine translocase TatA/TatE family subunit [Bacteroidales bacterium]|nr:twin-arginine translocase TatA/TatE family subunit [Bacteroidales bacterium]MCF8334300.1 twin-arginine translocase TatA/TatE family subunit [Bacteroidales bacterium]